jgi:hypothetical protein
MVSVYNSAQPKIPRECSQWLCLVEIDTADGAIMLLEAIN